MSAYENFIKSLVGDFDNQKQILLEQAIGNQTHPKSVHINRVFNDRIDGLPEGFEGTYILEESYYTYPGEETTVKPHLFLVKRLSDTSIGLNPTIIPDGWEPKDCTNANKDFRLNYADLKNHAWFGQAEYHMVGDRFHVNHLCEVGEGKTFNLIEYFTPDSLSVMELWKDNGKRLTPYQTPILYERLP